MLGKGILTLSECALDPKRAKWIGIFFFSFGTTCNVPGQTLGVAAPSADFPLGLLRHIGSLLHLRRRRACTSLPGYWGDLCKYSQLPASRTASPWRPSKPSTMRLVWNDYTWSELWMFNFTSHCSSLANVSIQKGERGWVGGVSDKAAICAQQHGRNDQMNRCLVRVRCE